MNPAVETILADVAGQRLSPRDSIAALVRLGFDDEDAEQAVFTTLGGGDLVTTGEDGLERYHHSGRLVTDVLADMER